jgi:hypothetical protein
MTAPSGRFRFPSSVVSDVIHNETIGINLETGDYFSLRGSASDIWILLRHRSSVGEIVETLIERSGAGRAIVEPAVTAFVEQLTAEGLVVRDDGVENQRLAGSPEIARRPFERPAIEKFTDMREFLLVDPIHEVDVTEWPHVRIRPDS